MIDDLHSYDRYVIALSGGKDCVAALLTLLDANVDHSKIELHHHSVDGHETPLLFDWSFTEDYCRKLAEAFHLPLYFSWHMGGLEREMLRENQLTAPTRWQNPDGTISQAGGTTGKLGTRRKFPQQSANLTVRWCSAYGKIDVLGKVLNNSDRFRDSRTLVITGERREESAARAKYAEFEIHRADGRQTKNKRHIDHYRPVIDFPESRVWDILRSYGVHPNVVYRLGFSRYSCMTCIFADDDQIASAYLIDPSRVLKQADYEKEFGCTIHRTRSLMERVARGTPYPMLPEDIEQARSTEYYQPILVHPDDWQLPLGAFGKGSGPT